MRAAAYTPDGKLERVLDLPELAALPEEDRANAELGGFDVASDGTIVFAIPVQFRVHAIDPDGAVRSFGKTGSAAGNFGVLSDVVLDRDGNIFVSDRQRSVVMVFTHEFRFLREFGQTMGREWLARPGAMALDPSGRLYVSQARNRGIAVYAIASAP
jgi:sugar lactone lactonase YvrE